MKELFQRKTFWAVLVILLLAVFIYPPWWKTAFVPYQGQRYLKEQSRYWDWIFPEPLASEWGNVIVTAEIDLRMILAESIIAILLTIGTFLIPFRRIGMLLGFIASGIKETLKEKPKD